MKIIIIETKIVYFINKRCLVLQLTFNNRNIMNGMILRNHIFIGNIQIALYIQRTNSILRINFSEPSQICLLL